MEKFTVLTGLVAPLDRANVDTDQIIPKEHLKSIKRTGFADALFGAWRHEPNFVLNQQRYKGAQILLARKNFGCGSSREHAAWALVDYGFRAVVSSSIADIFRANALKNGLLPVAVDEAMHRRLVARPGARVIIDLAQRTLELEGARVTFAIDPFARRCLLDGTDELGFLLAQQNAIAAHEKERAC